MRMREDLMGYFYHDVMHDVTQYGEEAYMYVGAIT
jgi:hypothetical protein